MKTNLTNWLCGLCAVLLIAGLIFQFKQQGRLDAVQQQQESLSSAVGQQQQEQRDAATSLANQVTNLGVALESRLTQSEQQAKEKAAEIANTVQQQTAVMHRALGKVIPVELPESLTKKLAALEARIADEKSWPKDAAEADTMLAELRDLVRQIPPWAEEDLLPRLNTLRWSASAITLLQSAQLADGNALSETIDDIDTVLTAMPDGAPTKVLAALTNSLPQFTARWDDFRRNVAREEANGLLQGKPSVQEFVSAIERLSEWENEHVEAELQRQLRTRLAAVEAKRFLDSTGASLTRAKSQRDLNYRLATLGRLMESGTAQRMVWDEDKFVSDTEKQQLARLCGDVQAAIEEAAKSITDKQSAEQDAKLREYQKYALTKVKEFQKQLEKRTSGINDKPGIQKDMIEYLVPISVGHLDPAVARIYNDAFQQGWNLINSEHQIKVAEQEAIVSKRKP